VAVARNQLVDSEAVLIRSKIEALRRQLYRMYRRNPPDFAARTEMALWKGVVK
jgi:hypothetical protein